MSFSAIEHRLLKLRSRRGGGSASYFGGDVSAVELAVADALSAVGNSGRSGVFSAAELLVDRMSVSGTVAGGNNDGLIVTNGSLYNPLSAQIQSIDINSSLPVAIGGGASVSYATEAWWNGTTTVGTFRPPTVNDQYCGFGGISFWRNATNVVRQANIRWEFKLSDEHLLGPVNVPGSGTGLPKWLIINAYRQLSTAEGIPNDRPMIFLAHMNEADNPANRIADALTAVPAQGTIRAFQTTNNVPAVTNTSGNWTGYQNALYQWHVRATAGTAANGGAIVDNDEYMCIEVRVNVMATPDEPNGVIAFRIYRRDGSWFERATAWTNTPLDNRNGQPTVNTNFIADIDVGGGGYYNLANSGSPNLWTKIGRRLTLATNYQPSVGRAWIGPPTGFVQQ